MRIGEVIGKVVLSKRDGSVPRARLLIVRPLGRAALLEGSPERGEDLVVLDELGAGSGSRVAFSEGREAANPFLPGRAPIDAYCACLIDTIVVDTDGSA